VDATPAGDEPFQAMSLTAAYGCTLPDPSPWEAIVTVDELIAQLQQCPQEFEVQVLEPRNEKDADGMFSVANVVPADKTPTIYLTA
jgi:hypothetical protein